MRHASIFIVERYLPGVSLRELSRLLERVGEAAAAMNAQGVSIRLLSSTFVPEEESCTCQFEASSSEAIDEANRRAGAGFARVIQAVRFSVEGK